MRPLRHIVRRHLDRHLVALQDSNAVLAHLTRRVGKNLVSVFEFHLNMAFGNTSVTVPLNSMGSSLTT